VAGVISKGALWPRPAKLKGMVVLLLSCSLLISCAQNHYASVNKPRKTACIKGGLANFIGHFTAGEAHVGLQPVPIKAGNPYREYCLPGGTRSFLVGGARGPGFGVNTVIIVQLLEGHKYRVRARYRSGIYHFAILDTTRESEAEIYKFSLPEGYYGVNIFSNKTVRPPIDLTAQFPRK